MQSIQCIHGNQNNVTPKLYFQDKRENSFFGKFMNIIFSRDSTFSFHKLFFLFHPLWNSSSPFPSPNLIIVLLLLIIFVLLSFSFLECNLLIIAVLLTRTNYFWLFSLLSFLLSLNFQIFWLWDIWAKYLLLF